MANFNLPAVTPQFLLPPTEKTCISLDQFTDGILAFLDKRTGALTVEEVLERVQQGGR